MYAYYITTENHIKRYKIYSPLAERRGKWLTNASSNTVQGIRQLRMTSYDLIVTKSLKDVMVLRVLGFEAIALQNEGAKIPTWVNSVIDTYYHDIFVLYDNDETGKVTSNALCDKHKYSKIEIPDFLYKESGIKDISDYVKVYGKKNGKELISNLISFEKQRKSDGDLPF